MASYNYCGINDDDNDDDEKGKALHRSIKEQQVTKIVLDLSLLFVFFYSNYFSLPPQGVCACPRARNLKYCYNLIFSWSHTKFNIYRIANLNLKPANKKANVFVKNLIYINCANSPPFRSQSTVTSIIKLTLTSVMNHLFFSDAFYFMKKFWKQEKGIRAIILDLNLGFLC